MVYIYIYSPCREGGKGASRCENEKNELDGYVKKAVKDAELSMHVGGGYSVVETDDGGCKNRRLCFVVVMLMNDAFGDALSKKSRRPTFNNLVWAL